YEGAVSLYDLAPALADPHAFHAVVAADLIDKTYPSVGEQERLAPTLAVFSRSDGEWLPVTDGAGVFKGILGKQDVLALYAQEVLGHPAMLARIAHEKASTYVPLPSGFVLRDIRVDGAFAGKALAELALLRRDETGRETRLLAGAQTQLRSGDVLVALGPSEAIARVSSVPG